MKNYNINIIIDSKWVRRKGMKIKEDRRIERKWIIAPRSLKNCFYR